MNEKRNLNAARAKVRFVLEFWHDSKATCVLEMNDMHCISQ
jgi:hypothetical protein